MWRKHVVGVIVSNSFNSWSRLQDSYVQTSWKLFSLDLVFATSLFSENLTPALNYLPYFRLFLRFSSGTHRESSIMHLRGLFFFYLKHVWGRANSREGGVFNLEKMMVSILHETLNVRAVKTSRDPCQSHNPYSTLVGSLSNDVFERRTSTGCALFAIFSRDFEQILGQNVPLRVKTLSNTNLVVSRYIQKKRKTLTSARRASLKHAAA